MEKILSKFILIKDCNNWKYLLLSLVIIGVISFNIPLTIKQSELMSLQQVLFVILSAILFVFHESIIGYSSISKLRNKIKKLASEELKEKVLAHVAIGNQGNNYDEFLKSIEKSIGSFATESELFKRHSYRLYVLFSIIGLVIILFSLITPPFSSAIINFLIYTQIFLIFIWVISAFQAEEQKILMFGYISPKNIKKNITDYIDSINEKNIVLEMDEQ